MPGAVLGGSTLAAGAETARGGGSIVVEEAPTSRGDDAIDGEDDLGVSTGLGSRLTEAR
jgi:hypothetical protein